MPLTASLVVSGISALGKTGVGIEQLIHSKKLADANKRPTFNIQDEYFNNRDIAENMAQHGLTDKSLDFYRTNAERGLTSGIDATLQGGGGVNQIQNLFDNETQSLNQISAKDAEQQNANIKYFMDANKDLAGQKTQAWVLNKYEPFKDKAKAAANERVAGLNNAFTGAGELASTFAAANTAQNNQDLLSTQEGANNSVANYFSNLSKTAPYPTAGNQGSNMFADFQQYAKDNNLSDEDIAKVTTFLNSKRSQGQ